MHKKKIIRVTTVPISLEKLLSGQLRYMNSFYEIIGVASDEKNLQKLTETEGITVHPIEMTRKITPFQDLKAVWNLYLYLKKTKPFIVHSHTPKAGITAMLAAKLAGVPHRLHTVAGLPLLEEKGMKRKILDRIEKLTYACATNVYPNSHGLLDIINQNGYAKAAKLKVLANGSSNGIDTEHFSRERFTEQQYNDLRKSLNISESDFVFIFVGRLVKDKGINEMVAAFTALAKENPSVKLLLVGDYENDLDPLSGETVKNINENPAIVSTGWQYDVRPYFGISNALAFPSYREGFPNVVMQAGALGVPCIVTDINGCNEIIEDGANGLVIPVKDENTLLTAMKKLAEDRPFLEKLREKSRPMIVTRYEQHLVWEAILQEYRKFENTPIANV